MKFFWPVKESRWYLIKKKEKKEMSGRKLGLHSLTICFAYDSRVSELPESHVLLKMCY